MARKVLGLDFDDKRIKAVEMIRRGRSKMVTALGKKILPPGTILEGEVKESRVLETELKGLLKENKFTAKSVVLGLGGAALTVKTHRLPQMSERELERALEFELPDLVNFPIQSEKEVAYDYYINKRTAADLEIVLVACRRSLLAPYLRAFKTVGLAAEVVDLPAFNWPKLVLENKRRAYVEIGENYTTIYCELDGAFKVYRVIPSGATQFRQGLEQAFQCSSREAEELCATKDIDHLLLEGTGSKSALRAVTRQFVAAILQTLDFLRAQERASSFREILDEVLLLGSLGNLKGLGRLLQEEVDLTIKSLDSLEIVRWAPSLAEPRSGAAYASALALALRGYEK
ncbi:MAG: pilus assembly protein PilM [Firmicutes bacterium]|nr:pilus assembly protein PilM [Bacillota bacterium]